jgi:putative transcriptional regulator
MTKEFNLKGHFLVAMPSMEDNRFSRTVIFIANHDADGAMGFILNHKVQSPTFQEILEELDVQPTASAETEFDAAPPEISVFSGGPVEQGRGFVIHSLDFSTKSSVRIGDLACVTATLDALRVLASSARPQDHVMLLGYSGWGKGQLEQEIAQNGWLTLPATRKLLFQTDYTLLYEEALSAMGISEASLSSNAGHA